MALGYGLPPCNNNEWTTLPFIGSFRKGESGGYPQGILRYEQKCFENKYIHHKKLIMVLNSELSHIFHCAIGSTSLSVPAV